MGLLDRAQRRRLLDILEAIPFLNTIEGRTLLLRDLPAPLVHTIQRSASKVEDLSNIVGTCDADIWIPEDPTGAHPLRILVEAARDLIEGTRAAGQLQDLLDRLFSVADVDDPTSRPPLCPFPGMVPFRSADARFFYGMVQPTPDCT